MCKTNWETQRQEESLPSNKRSSGSVSIVINTKSAQELVLEDPRRQKVVEKLNSLAGLLDYKNPRGRGAINPVLWIQENIVNKGFLTKDEVELIPLFAWRPVLPKLHQALADTKSSNI